MANMSGTGSPVSYRHRWYVRYPDGHRSVGMKYSVARSYRAIFGGAVFHETLWFWKEQP